ncbi:hypothetical protein F0562_012321 [Nyssa sinensis]|uniref:Uncharacterized protein n=1 Tax=Nyssa sinensis TaxID=561372 RepID=A0A5J4ZUH2_9ASTE|nr:hypothetical protein F0562_012321 [Nyssa sinensis]
MDEEEIEKAVIAYLKKKGFRQTELAFQEEQQQTKTSSSISSTNSRTDPGIAKHILSFTEVKMIQLPANTCLGQMVGEDHIHYCRVILGLFIQSILVLLGIFFYPLHRIEQLDYGAQNEMQILCATRVIITLYGMFSLVR